MPKLTPIPPDKRPLISALLDRGMSMRVIGEKLGYTYGQVKGTVERYRLRKTPAPNGTPKFTPERKAKLLAMAKRMVGEGKTMPVIAAEIERITGKSISSNTVREWMPSTLAPKIQENAIAASVLNSRARRANQRKRLTDLLAENERLRSEITRLRVKLARAQQ